MPLFLVVFKKKINLLLKLIETLFLHLFPRANQNTNWLYLNQRNFVFEEIKDTAKVRDDKGWTTGVTMIGI
jgi:hypothetical protein